MDSKQLEIQENLHNAITKYIVELKEDDYNTGYKLAEIILLHDVDISTKDLIDGFIDKVNEYQAGLLYQKYKKYIQIDKC